MIGDWLSKRLGQQFIVENRPGAGNNLATEAVAKAAADGYTLILVNPANAINASLYKNLNFVFLRDIDPVVGVIRVPNVMEVHPSVPAKTVAEFIAYVKANPDKVNIASSGNGTSIHLSGELFKMMTGTTMTHIPYKGSAPMLTDLLGGQVQVTFDNLPSSIAHIKAGKLRALAVTTATAFRGASGRADRRRNGAGLMRRAHSSASVCRTGTPKEIVDRLNTEVNLALKDPAILAKLKDLGGTPIPGSPADFGKARCGRDRQVGEGGQHSEFVCELICATDRIGNSRQTGAASPVIWGRETPAGRKHLCWAGAAAYAWRRVTKLATQIE